MSAVIIAILALVAFGLALHPLFREEPLVYAPQSVLDPELENLLSAREATYGAIKDLESDHTQGKLSDADYQTLRAKYETKALGILQQLDQGNQRIAASAKHSSVVSGRCPQCGEPYSAGHKFCRRCGAHLVPTCSACGAPLKAGAKFCARCGTPVAALQPA